MVGKEGLAPRQSLAEDEEPFRFDELYRSHGHWLIRFLRRRFGREQADDLAQEVYLRLLSAKGDVRHPRAFLARVALNAARDQIRRRAVRPVLVSADAAAPPAVLASQPEAILLKQAVLALPPKLQEVFVLSRFAGLTYEDIALRCGLSVKTIEGRMTKAFALLASVLSD
jgi:RNA polymerase sigma-70 factor (ECF subfamily)